MAKKKKQLWQGLTAGAQRSLVMRDYAPQSFGERLAGFGIEAGKLTTIDRTAPEVREAWIPGVEIFSRTIHHQRHRGVFGEFIRRDEGLFEKIGFWPTQWANARMLD